MYFNVNDVKQFQTQKDFIDTAIVPLLSLDFGQEAIKSSSATEFLMTLTMFIEQQFKGRLMMLPPFSYIEETKSGLFVPLLKQELEKAGFKHVLFLTCDHSWTSLNDQIDLIWLPAIPIESMDSSMKTKIMEEQLKQVIPILTAKWN